LVSWHVAGLHPERLTQPQDVELTQSESYVDALMTRVNLYPREKPRVWTLHRQTTLPPVGRGPRLRRFAPFRSRSTPRASPPSSRGVCLVFSSCPGPLTTMTGSELAGHRLLKIDFEKVYGSIGKNEMHVHHLMPLFSEITAGIRNRPSTRSTPRMPELSPHNPQ